ncbi:flagellar basal-body MS-ring/collar protein FliF [Nitrococcus mobilis]|uniref:Flagellar M-ring protein n=1 Tax=Nitrococcus mobilis Nb-231 TaxID=314278 RepID=A4BUD5_9GAMM|nr:flagellar basal-body MS-ring/collar protein FliF [Nitrococcus mobilis]EAR20649.1 flagellar M-ring protein [Nitrococcus mobilis Nb-231]
MAANQALAPTADTNLKPQRQKDDERGRLGVLLSEYLGERALRQMGLIIGLALAVAAGLALFMWAQEPTYRALYANLPTQDASAVADALQTANIPHRLDTNSGAILVPAQRLSEARLKLAGQGLPHTGGVGFESLRQEQGFGTSQFMETARFQRALETELARTIDALDPVARSRVHLAIPERSVFVRDRKTPSAAVSIGLYPGRVLSSGQVLAIAHLVASAVPAMTASAVTIVDQRGRLLSRVANEGEGLNATVQQLAFRHRVEEAYARRIEDLLTPIVGAGHVKAQVNARVDFSAQERTEELYQPEQSVVRSEQSMKERTERSQKAIGVPGALSNQPPGTGTLQPAQPGKSGKPVDQQEAANQTSAPELVDSRISHTRNYEISKTIHHVRTPRGAITRLSVAVLLDRPAIAAKTKDKTQAPPQVDPQVELAELTELVKQVVGFDADRGDTINLISSPFQPPEEAPPAHTPLWQQPWVSEGGKLLLASLLGLVLILAVVRPLVHGLLGRDRSERPDSAAQAQIHGGADADADAALTGPAEPKRLGTVSDYNDRLQIARDVVGKEPAVAANVMKHWLAQENE